MTSSIILPSEFDVSKLNYNDVKRLDNGGKVVYIGYNKRPLILQTCECYAPFGVQSYSNDDGKSESYSIELSFKDMETRKTLQTLHKVLSEIDERNIEEGITHATDWGLSKKKSSKEVIEALYTTIVKVPKEPEKYPSTFKIKIPYRNGNFACDVFDANQNMIDLKQVLEGQQTKGSKITAMIQCTGIWMAGSKFGCSWKLVQMKCVMQTKMTGFCLRDVPDEDNDIEEDMDADEVPPVLKKQEASEIDEQDEDEEDEEEDEEDEEPVQVPVRKKK